MVASQLMRNAPFGGQEPWTPPVTIDRVRDDEPTVSPPLTEEAGDRRYGVGREVVREVFGVQFGSCVDVLLDVDSSD